MSALCLITGQHNTMHICLTNLWNILDHINISTQILLFPTSHLLIQELKCLDPLPHFSSKGLLCTPTLTKPQLPSLLLQALPLTLTNALVISYKLLNPLRCLFLAFICDINAFSPISTAVCWQPLQCSSLLYQKRIGFHRWMGWASVPERIDLTITPSRFKILKGSKQ